MSKVDKIYRDIDEMVGMLDVGVTDKDGEEIIDLIHDCIGEIEDFVSEDEKITDEDMDKIFEIVDRMISQIISILKKS